MEGIEARLDTVDGLRTSAYQPGQINPPQAVVGFPPISDLQTSYGRGKFDLDPTVTVLTSAAFDRIGQFALADLVPSIIKAIHADPTLGGAAESAQVTEVQPLSIEQVGVIDYFGSVLTLRVMAQFTL